MALEIPSVSETVEEPADFQGWTSAFNAIDERYDAEQLEISDAFAMDSLAIEQDIEAEKNRILTDLNESLQQQLMKMHKAIEESIDRQVKGRLRLEQRKRDHATKKAALDKCRLAEIRSLYDENRTRTLQVTEQNTTQRRAIKDHISLENKGSSLLRHPTPPNGESTPSGSNRLREDGQDFASSRISSEGSDEDEDDDGMSSSSQRPSVSGARSPLPSSNTLSFGSAARSPTSGPEPAMSSKTSDHAIDSVQPALGSSLDLAHPLKRKVDEMATTVTDPVKRTRVSPDTLSCDEVSIAEIDDEKRTSRCSSLKSSNSKRTISFDEVFQEGSAQYKHMIIEYPPGEGQFYILKCDEHHVHFGLNPLHGAAKHLSSAQHRNQPKMHSLAIETLGHYVFDCDQHLAEKNNAVVKRAFKEGYEPFNANRLTKGERISQGYEALHSLSIQTTPSRHSEKGPHKPVGNNSKPFMGIANPVAGELYLGYWSKTKTKYPVIVLPWGDLRVAGIPATLSQTSLKNNIPRCYIVDRMTQNIKGWAKAYEDDGSLVHKREFPVYYFDRNRSVGWLAAKYLSEFNMEDPKSNQYPAYNDARDHYSRARGYKDYLDWKEKNGVRGSTRASHSDQTTSGVLTAPATKATCPASASMIASSNEAVGDEPRGSMHPIADVDLAVEPNNAYAEQGVETVNTGHLPKDAYTGLHVVRSPSPVPAAQAQAADGHQNAGVKPKFIPTNASKSPANGHVVAPLAHELHAPVDAEIQHPYLGQMQPASVGASSAPGISLANQVVPASAPLASNNTPQTAQQIARTVLQMSPMQKNGVVNDHGKSVKTTIENERPWLLGNMKGSLPTTSAPSGEGEGPVPVAVAAGAGVQRSSLVAGRPLMPRPRVPGPPHSALGNEPTLRSSFCGPVHSGGGISYSSREPISTASPNTVPVPAISGLSLPHPARPNSRVNVLSRHVSSELRPTSADQNAKEQLAATSGAVLPSPQLFIPPHMPQWSTTTAAAQRVISPASVSPSVSFPPRSTSSTPGPPASETTSRKSTPAAIRPDDKQADRWRAIRNSSFSGTSTSSGISSFGGLGSAGESQERRVLSVSSLTSPSLSSSSISASSFIKMEVSAGTEKEQYFDLAAYREGEDSSRRAFERQHAGQPYLRLVASNVRRVAETAAGGVMAVTIDPCRVLSIVTDPVDVISGRTSVTLMMGDGREPTRVLVFETKQTGGRLESGKIQARRFSLWVMSVNPSVDYQNLSVDSGRRSGSVSQPQNNSEDLPIVLD